MGRGPLKGPDLIEWLPEGSRLGRKANTDRGAQRPEVLMKKILRERSLSLLLGDGELPLQGRMKSRGGRARVGGAREELWCQAGSLGFHSACLCYIRCLGQGRFQL